MDNSNNIPTGYQRIMPYLVIKNAKGFIDFMQKAFGATEQFKELRPEDNTLIKHAEISISGSTIMLADSNEAYPVQNAGMFVYVDNCDDVYQKAIANGAESLMEPADQSYGRSAGVKDPFGNTWWIVSVI